MHFRAVYKGNRYGRQFWQPDEKVDGREKLPKKSDPYLFNLFINDLDLVSCLDTSLKKYDDHDTTMQGIVNKAELIVLVPSFAIP